MKRDVVPKSTVATFVGLQGNLNDKNLSSHIDVEDGFIDSGLTKERYLLEKEFYKTYNPDVGFNTAFVLGVMLGTLLLYVIYRTKIRKPLIAFLKRKFKEIRRRGMPPEVPSFPDIEVRDNCEPNDNEAGDTAECPDDVFFEEVEKINDEKKYHLLPTFSFSEDEKQLPILVMDMKSATADWVQQQHNFLEPGALILKVKSDTICPQGNEINPSKVQTPSNTYGAISQHCLTYARTQRPYIHNCKYSSSLNQSLPTLKTQDLILSADSDGKHQKKIRLKGMKQQSLTSEPRSPLPQSHLKQPVHLTPIIKIQNYDKSQRNSNETEKDRRDSVSSSSSDDPQILRFTAEKWNKSKELRRSVTHSDVEQESACPYCKSTNKSSALQQYSLDIPSEKQTLCVPVIGFTGTSRSCQNISQMETTL